MTDEKDEIFPEISADAENITTIESLCLRCHEQVCSANEVMVLQLTRHPKKLKYLHYYYF